MGVSGLDSDGLYRLREKLNRTRHPGRESVLAGLSHSLTVMWKRCGGD